MTPKQSGHKNITKFTIWKVWWDYMNTDGGVIN
jgi:hypothetical protein